MAMTIVESTRPVTGGVDTHADVHVAAAVDTNGGVLGVVSFATTPVGYLELHHWLAKSGTVDRVGVEGTGAYGAGLARHLRGQGLVVIEVDRPNRQERRRNGKSDELDAIEADAADLLAIVAGQDVAEGDDGVFRIVRGVARDRVISTVDPQARHGHKSKNRRFDGYKTHASVDPDSELIDEVAVTPANTPDRDAVDDLLVPSAGDEGKPEVVGDSAYADGETRDRARQARLCDQSQGAADPQPRRPVHQGPVPDRPRRQQGHLPGGNDGDHHRVTTRCRQGQLRCPLHDMPAAQALRYRAAGPLDQHPPSRSDPAGRPQRASHTRMGRALPRSAPSPLHVRFEVADLEHAEVQLTATAAGVVSDRVEVGCG
jgi:hypothetical protein